MSETEHDGQSEPFEALLAECLERRAADGPQGLEAVLDSNPELAGRLRERIAALERLGLVGPGDARDDPPRFGRYQVVRRLGHGGMSLVYLVRDAALGREVALKISALPVEPASRSAERFAREARAVSQLTHPCIVPVHDVGEADGRPFFTMEYVEGATLDRVIDALRASGKSFEALTGADVRRAAGADAAGGEATYVETVCRIVLDVADALAHAHRYGVVHRDVKPSNVFVRADGRAQLFDFGLARLLDLPALTRTGEFMGTPYYVSPEQLGSRGEVDERVDVYALGVTLYELLCLRRPFEGQTTAEVFRAILTREPTDLARANRLVPRELATLCHAALEKDPRRRYRDVASFADDLRRFLAFRPVRARAPGLARRALRAARQSPLATVGLAVAATLVVGLPAGLLLANAAVRAERDEAERQATLRGEVVEFLVGLFRLSGEADEGSRRGARELLERGRNELERGAGHEPLERAALLAASGRAFHALGLESEAVDLLNRSHALFANELGSLHPETLAVLTTLAEVHLEEGRDALAYGIATRALQAPAFPAAEERRCRVTRARAAARLGRREEARAELEEVLATSELDAGAEAEVREHLGALELGLGGPDRARPHLERALALREAEWSPEPEDLIRAHTLLADCAERSGDARARDLHRARAARFVESDLAAAPAAAPFRLVPRRTAEYRSTFQSAISAHIAGDLERAVADFERCLALLPDEGVTAYNLACAWGARGRAEEAARWLGEAQQRGFGSTSARHESLLVDPDLDPVRGHPRVREALARLDEQYRRARAYVESPRLVEPPGHAAAPLPLLVLVHADGATKDGGAAGEWGEAAAELGLGLLVPSGPRGLGAGPEDGMSWIEDEELFLEDPRSAGAGVLQAVRALAEVRALDREKVFLAGEGAGGALAFDVALRAPGLFRGVVLLDAPLHPESADDRARRAAALGLRVLALYESDGVVPGTDRAADATLAADVEAWLAGACGFGAGARVVVEGDARRRMVERLRRFVLEEDD